jgi:hypothetical protein
MGLFSLKDYKHRFIEKFKYNSLPAKPLLHQILVDFIEQLLSTK